MTRRIDWIFAAFGCLALATACDGQALDQPAEVATDAQASIDTTPACVPCVIDVSWTEWRATGSLDVLVRSTRGALPVHVGDVCMVVAYGSQFGPLWVVKDNGENTGYTQVAHAIDGATMTCEAP